MVKRILLLVFSWAVSAPLFAAPIVSYTDEGQIYTGCTSPGTWQQTGSGPNAGSYGTCPSNTYSWRACGSSPATVTVRCFVSSCPAGTTPVAGKCEAPAGASEADKAEAEDKARKKAKSRGLDQTAQDAAGAKARQVMDDFIGAGKTKAESLAAAEWAGEAAALENAHSRVNSTYNTALDAVRACYAANLSGCDSKMEPYYAAAAAVGLDPTKSPTLYGSSNGKNYQYVQLSNGTWDVFEEGTSPTNPGKYIGNQPTISNIQPSTTQTPVPGGQPTTTVTNVATSSPHKAVIDNPYSTTPKITYYDQATGQPVATAQTNPNGTVSCIGNCTGINASNDMAVATVGASSGSSGGTGTGGPVQIGDPTGSVDGSLGGEKSAFNDASETRKTGVNDIGAKGQGNEGGLLSWLWFPTIPATQCSDPSMTVSNWTLTFTGFCEKADWIRQIAAYALYIFTAFSLFNILTGRNTQGDK